MAKDTLKKLDRDIDRMLFAGAQIARTDPGLAGARDKLAPLAARAPALGRVVDQIDRLHKATGKAAAIELLGLSSLMAQVRGAQASLATPAEPGELAPLPARPRIATPLWPTDLGMLVAALTNAPDARHRSRVIRDLAERGSARDLRIIPLCIPALSDGVIAEAVEQSLVPSLGEAIVPELRAELDLKKGRGLDVRLLRAIARIEGERARALLLSAIEQGEADMRAAAIGELGRVDPETAEPIAVALAEGDRSREVRSAALVALATATGDAALDVLLRAFEGGNETRPAAKGSLSASKHPMATERIMGLLTRELRELQQFKIKKATTREEKAAASKAEDTHRRKIDYLIALVDLIASRNTEKATELVLGTFRDHKLKQVRDAAARGLLRVGYLGAWEELAPSLYDASDAVQREFTRGVISLDPARAHDRLARFFDPSSTRGLKGAGLALQILGQLEGPGSEGEEASEEASRETLLRSDPRWVELVIQQAEVPALRGGALRVLLRARTPRSLEAGLSVSRADGLTREDAMLAFTLLAQHRDPRLGPAFLRLLEPLRGLDDHVRACSLMTEHDDPALAPALRSWLSAKKRLSHQEKAPFEECLRFLERDRSAPAAEA